MKKLVLGVISAGTLVSPSVCAGIEANVGFVSDYRFRGISQSDNAPAIQGGLDYAWDNGVSVGIWGSSIAFADGMEMDWHIGIAGTTSSGLGWDVALLHYAYPGQRSSAGLDNDFTELHGSLAYDFGPAGVRFGLNWSNDYFASSGHSLYTSLDVELPLPGDFGLSLHYGHQAIDRNANWGTPDYHDWGIGISTSAWDLDFGLNYSDTDISRTGCFGGDNLCGGTVYLSAGRNF